jgi:hypothetical protein
MSITLAFALGWLGGTATMLAFTLWTGRRAARCELLARQSLAELQHTLKDYDDWVRRSAPGADVQPGRTFTESEHRGG